MSLIQAVILGIVEGVTEFLPISSTGHLILAANLLGIPKSEFLKSFEIAVQAGAILAVAVLYWRSFVKSFETLKRVLAAFLPTAFVGFVFYKPIKKFLLGGEEIVLFWLFAGGILLILFEYFYREKQDATADITQISYGKALAIGVCQSVAVIPGVSRSAATILGGLGLGLKRQTIVEFSFLLALPTLLAATGLDLLKNADGFSGGECLLLLVGSVTSFLAAVPVIRYFLRFIQHHSFLPFGIYRIVLAALFWLFA